MDFSKLAQIQLSSDTTIKLNDIMIAVLIFLYVATIIATYVTVNNAGADSIWSFVVPLIGVILIYVIDLIYVIRNAKTKHWDLRKILLGLLPAAIAGYIFACYI